MIYISLDLVTPTRAQTHHCGSAAERWLEIFLSTGTKHELYFTWAFAGLTLILNCFKLPGSSSNLLLMHTHLLAIPFCAQQPQDTGGSGCHPKLWPWPCPVLPQDPGGLPLLHSHDGFLDEMNEILFLGFLKQATSTAAVPWGARRERRRRKKKGQGWGKEPNSPF